jgi:hypothetical protein
LTCERCCAAGRTEPIGKPRPVTNDEGEAVASLPSTIEKSLTDPLLSKLFVLV